MNHYKLLLETVVIKPDASPCIANSILDFPSSGTRDRFIDTLQKTDNGVGFTIHRKAIIIPS